MILSQKETERYSRHLMLPEVGIEGQQQLKAGKVLLVGAGGLGSPVALYLAAAGVGTIGIIDFDRVDLTNLQRQILHGTSDIGRMKVDSARKRLADVNPEIAIDTIPEKLSALNAKAILSKFDVIVDGTDNFTTRYLVNDACVMLGKPNVSGSIFRFEGQVSVFAPGRGPCYRCLFPEPPPPELAPSCAEAGVLGILPGVVGLLQATETIKLLLGLGDPLIGRLLLFDAMAARFREVKVPRNTDCPMCGDRPSIKELVEYDPVCATGTGGVAAMSTAQGKPGAPAPAGDMTPEELKRRIDLGDAPVIVDVRNPHEFAICSIAGSKLIPLTELARRMSELDPEEEIVVHCKMGPRGSTAVALLKQQGFTNVRNLAGGILAWAQRIDPTMKTY